MIGTIFPREEDQVGSYLGLDARRWKSEVHVVMGDFVVKFRVRSKVDGFNWALVAVYGAA